MRDRHGDGDDRDLDDKFRGDPNNNNNDINFIPIAEPLEDPPVDYGDISSINRWRRRRKHHHPHWPPYVTPVPIRELYDYLFDADDYFTNPLVSHTVFSGDDINVEDIDQILSQFQLGIIQQQSQQQPVQAQSARALAVNTPTGSIPSLLRPDVSNQTNVKYPNDLYNVPGKVTKHGDIKAQFVDIPQNSNWAGAIDYYEEGRLVAFSITCNDPDMVPTIFVESGSSSQTIINDMSYRQLVQHGRGMTYSAATSVINSPTGPVSRDVQGTPSALLPYVARYKDTYGGSGVYADVKNTVDDKSYVLTYEPTTSIPYQRLNINIYNGSPLGTRTITNLEVKRVVYVDPDPPNVSTASLPDISRFTSAIGALGGTMGAQQPPSLTTFHGANLAQQVSGDDEPASHGGGGLMQQMYDDFIAYMYKKRFLDRKVKVEHDKGKGMSLTDHDRVNDMLAQLDGKRSTPTINKKKNIKGQQKVMTLNWE